MSIRRYDDIELDQINYSKPEKLGSSYFGSLSYGSNLRPLYIQTPKLKCKTNISEIKNKKNPYLDLEIPQGSFDMYDLFLNLDDKNIKTTVSNSNEWFKKDLSLEVIDDMYKRITKPFKKDNNPILRFKLPVIKNEIQCGVYNQQKVFIDLDEVKENMDVVLILHIRGLKILKQYFYCDCYISQIKVFQENEFSKYNIISEYSMIDDEKNDDDNIFDEEILDSFVSDEEKKQQKLKEKEEREKKEKEELEKKEKEDKIRLIQEQIKKDQEELEKKRIEMENLLKN